MNRRRRLLQAVAAAPLAGVTLLRAQTSVGAIRRVGILAAGTHPKMEAILATFFAQMRQLGWIEGQNIAYDRVYADDQQLRLPALAVELVSRKPEVIYAPPAPAAVAAQHATQTIPIVFGLIADPVGMGLVRDLAHPGGNITGMAAGFAATSIVSKRIEMLREILPAAKRLGLIGDSTDPSSRLTQQALAPLAASLGLTFSYAEAANPAEFEIAAAKLFADRVDAISPVGTATLIGSLRERLIELASQRRIPVIAGSSFYTDAGALISYGPLALDVLRRSALLVDKILRGARPGDMPVEAPTVFEMIVNQKTAKALGIVIPSSILLRADRVIE